MLSLSKSFLLWFSFQHFFLRQIYIRCGIFSSFSRKEWKETSNLHGKDINNISCSSCHLKVGLQNVDGSWKCFMATATEERDSSIQQDGGNQRCVGNTSQAFDATLKAPYKKRKWCVNILYQESKKKAFTLEKHSWNTSAGQREIRSSMTTHNVRKSVKGHRLMQLMSFPSCYLTY